MCLFENEIRMVAIESIVTLVIFICILERDKKNLALGSPETDSRRLQTYDI
jgi:hypothetical protein